MDSPGVTGADLSAFIAASVREQFPDLASARYQVTRLARVVARTAQAGTATHLDARHTVDVQPLLASRQDDVTWPVITGVPVPVLWAGPARGIHCLPAVGAIVRLSFLYGQPDAPVIDAYSAEGFAAPGGVTALRIQVGAAGLLIGEDGTIELYGAAVKLGGAAARSLLTDLFLQHTHPILDGVTGTAVAPPGSTTLIVSGQ
ncbi:MAG: hypothetical protein IV100_12630 [Myxococcales bacterium]|uniref:hypothetical protein n=1 Tax=Sediminibacterium sp. TaxID=1917865 RepID=UPI001DB3A68D|nr:hypothetical protein [Sediminibacterium sp.]MBT9485844.1 hypothetical protein [Sediminibacterium sp.]MBT9556872.1 hypothetical protein [Myxococcales bacterium]